MTSVPAAAHEEIGEIKKWLAWFFLLLDCCFRSWKVTGAGASSALSQGRLNGAGRGYVGHVSRALARLSVLLLTGFHAGAYPSRPRDLLSCSSDELEDWPLNTARPSRASLSIFAGSWLSRAWLSRTA